MAADVVQLADDALRVTFRCTRETWLWVSRGAGWFEESRRLDGGAA